MGREILQKQEDALAGDAKVAGRDAERGAGRRQAEEIMEKGRGVSPAAFPAGT